MRDLFWKNEVSFAEEAIGNVKFSYKTIVHVGRLAFTL